MSNLAKYQQFDLEAAEEEQEVLDEGAGEFVKPKPGKNIYRFLPTPIEWNTKSPFVKVYQHYLDIQGKSVSFNCPRLMAKRACLACAHSDKLRATGNPRDRDAAYQYQPKLRVFASVLDRSAPDKGPQIFAFGKKIFEQLVGIRKDEEDGGDFTEPGAEGFDIVITKTGEKRDTEYSVKPARNNSALGDMDVIAAQRNPAGYKMVPSDSEIAAMLGLDDTGPTTSAPSGDSGGGGRGRRGRATIDTSGTEVDED